MHTSSDSRRDSTCHFRQSWTHMFICMRSGEAYLFKSICGNHIVCIAYFRSCTRSLVAYTVHLFVSQWPLSVWCVHFPGVGAQLQCYDTMSGDLLLMQSLLEGCRIHGIQVSQFIFLVLRLSLRITNHSLRTFHWRWRCLCRAACIKLPLMTKVIFCSANSEKSIEMRLTC